MLSVMDQAIPEGILSDLRICYSLPDFLHRVGDDHWAIVAFVVPRALLEDGRDDALPPPRGEDRSTEDLIHEIGHVGRQDPG